MFVSGVELPQTMRKSNGGGRIVHLPEPYLPGSAGQLSLIQRVRLSSLTSPAARERMIAVACAGIRRNEVDAVHAQERPSCA